MEQAARTTVSSESCCRQVPLEKAVEQLKSLATSCRSTADGCSQKVALLVLWAKFNPILHAHVAVLESAARALQIERGIPVVAALLVPAPDSYVARKCDKKRVIPLAQRIRLCRAACESSSWIDICQSSEIHCWRSPTRAVYDVASKVNALAHVAGHCWEFEVWRVVDAEVAIRAPLREKGLPTVFVARNDDAGSLARRAIAPGSGPEEPVPVSFVTVSQFDRMEKSKLQSLLPYFATESPSLACEVRRRTHSSCSSVGGHCKRRCCTSTSHDVVAAVLLAEMLAPVESTPVLSTLKGAQQTDLHTNPDDANVRYCRFGLAGDVRFGLRRDELEAIPKTEWGSDNEQTASATVDIAEGFEHAPHGLQTESTNVALECEVGETAPNRLHESGVWGDGMISGRICSQTARNENSIFKGDCDYQRLAQETSADFSDQPWTCLSQEAKHTAATKASDHPERGYPNSRGQAMATMFPSREAFPESRLSQADALRKDISSWRQEFAYQARRRGSNCCGNKLSRYVVSSCMLGTHGFAQKPTPQPLVCLRKVLAGSRPDSRVGKHLPQERGFGSLGLYSVNLLGEATAENLTIHGTSLIVRPSAVPCRLTAN